MKYLETEEIFKRRPTSYGNIVGLETNDDGEVVIWINGNDSTFTSAEARILGDALLKASAPQC